MSFRSGCSGLVVSVAFVLLAMPARAERSRVALVRGALTDDAVAEVTSRMQAELAASGFDVTVFPLAANVDMRKAVELATTEPGVVATFAIVSVGKQAAIDVWLPDRITGKTTMKRLDLSEMPASRGPADLAIRAVELLRASLLETIVPLANPVDSGSASDSSDVSRFVDHRSPARPTERPWPGVSTFEAGIGVLNGFAGLGFSVTPVLRFAYVTPVDVLARITLSGPSLGPELHTATGSATTRQEFGLVEVAYPLRLGPAALFGSVGAGVYHLEINGSPIPPYGGGSPELWSVLFDVGTGGALRMGKHTAVVLDIHALATLREALVTFADGETRRSGRPIALTTLGLWVGL